ncbi:L-selectin-like [Penaeus chinensis]|uniref:L-selectin-like n=1 Tax=Penaeus chinensis TaxID=139456 RepID=UPI001FB5D756|nr:L-selectin-like [Penaeus chinensis]
MNRILLLACVLVLSAGRASGQGRFLERPVASLCTSRPSHDLLDGHRYFYSWLDPSNSNTFLDWVDARNWCRRKCMDLVAFEDVREYQMVSRRMLASDNKFYWTSGRRCDFDDTCLRHDLQPVDINGWFWSASNKKMRPTNHRSSANDWSFTGGYGRPQPDNRERSLGGDNESCLAVLNNHYNDGVRWHDVACHHRKNWVCEDSDELLAFVRRNNPYIRL